MTAEPREVSSEEIVAYQDLIHTHARRLDGFDGAEYDDLFQEGSLCVFLALREGKLPSKDIVVKRMHDWVRTVARQRRGEVPEADESVLEV